MSKIYIIALKTKLFLINTEKINQVLQYFYMKFKIKFKIMLNCHKSNYTLPVKGTKWLSWIWPSRIV